MSLNWNAKSVTDWDSIDPQKRESLIFATMFTDIGVITEENQREFYGRYLQFCRATGTEPYLTPGDVKSAIGLQTNVFTTTTAAYRKRIREVLESSVEDAVARDYRAMEKEEASNG